MPDRPPRVFISYSQDSPAHCKRVLGLANRLVGDGLDCIIDQYEPHPKEPWPRWMDRQIEEADFVVVVCTETYLRRASGRANRDTGRGATFESVLIIQDLYDTGMWNEKFIPVLLDEAPVEYVPKPLRGYTHYRADAERGYEDLYRHLTRQPRVVKPPAGRHWTLAPEPLARLRPSADTASGGTGKVNFRHWKHASAILTAFGSAGAAVGVFIDPLIAAVAGVVAALGGTGMYFFGEAAEKQLKPQADVQESGQRPGSVERSEGVISIPIPAEGGAAHSDIDEAFRYMAEGRPEVTIDLLQKIKKERWDRLSDRERYRVLANLGNARLARQDKTGAARDYIRASEYQPVDEDARSLEALGHLLLRDRQRAHELAVALCRDHPGLGRAHMVRIRTAPEDTSLEELLESVPIAARGHPEVVLALHDRAAASGRLEEAERILRDRPEGEDWTLILLALGSTVLQQELDTIRITLTGPVLSERERMRLSEAADLFTKALDQLPKGDPEGLAFGAYLNRGTCRELLGEFEPAHEDFRKAREREPSNERAAISLARSSYSDRQSLDESIGILEDYLKDHVSPRAKLLLADFLRQREGPEDLNRAAEMIEDALRTLTDFEEDVERTAILEALADLYIRMGKGDRAARTIEELPQGTLEPASRHALLGDVLQSLGKEEEALAQAQAAKDALGDSSDWNKVRHVALLFERMGRYSEAFELWRRIVTPTFVSVETHHLLNCAKRAGDDKFVLEFGQQLRAAGLYDHRAFGYEVETLTHYSEFAAAREAFSEYLAAKPDDKVVRLHLSVLAIQQGWKDLVENNPSQLPTVEEVESAQIGRLVADVFRAGPNPIQAVDYAYHLYRRFPDEAAAHQALIVAVLVPGPPGLSIEKPDAVKPGTAVCYSEVGSDERRWLVVEDAENPSLSRGEYTPTHGLVRAMLGKGIGDVFPLSEGRVRDRSGTVIDILDKRVYRANELMHAWTERFPENRFLEPIPVKSSDSPSPEDLAEVIKVMERLTEQHEKVEQAYAAGKLPISTFAFFNNRTTFESVGYLAVHPDLQVHACRGTTQDLKDAVTLLDSVTLAVLDPTAVATLALLEQVSVLDLLPFRCLVTEGTLQELRDLAREDSLSTQAGGYMGYKGGRLWLHEADKGEETKRLERLREVVLTLEQRCEVIGGSDLAQVDTSVREQLSKCVAQGSAEAAAVANRQNATLWTDDHLLHELIKGDLPATRIWTQAVFIWADQKGIVARERRSQVSARMLCFGYNFTSSNAITVLDTCEAASWRLEDPNLAAVLADFGNPAWDHDGALRITVQTIARVWREAPTEEHARAITARLLSHLADRQDYRTIIRFLITNVDSLLGLALTRTDPLRQILQAFLQDGIPPL